MSITTNALQNELMYAGDFKKILDENADVFAEQPISEYLSMLCEKYSMEPGRVIRQAHIERTYGYQIFNGTRNPSRDKLLQIVFGFGLSLDETQYLLKKAGKNGLYPKIKRDAACIFGLSHQMKLLEVQELLASVELPILGEV